MANNLPKFLEGGPKGYEPWLIGDDSHQRLTAYHEGQDVDLDEYELHFLENLTHPKAKSVLAYEDWSVARESGIQGEKGTLSFYIPKEQSKDRWNISRNNRVHTEEESRILGLLALSSRDFS